MLNPSLKKDVEVEIDKADPKIKDFLLDDYFRETMDLIFRVNRLTNEQGEAVELETILFLLKLSNYENINDAIQTECNIENPSTSKQIIADLNSYIFEKTKKMEEVPGGLEEDKVVTLPVKENTGEDLTQKRTEESSVALKESSESVENDVNKGFNMLGSNKIVKEARDILKDEIPFKKEDSSLLEKINTPVENIVPVIKTPEPLGDVYLERVSDEEKSIKKEIIVTNNN